ncbi:type II and III secretion system protein family protein [Methyloglobulus sp.]|uniref:type II and III secretion system protein family protein n=1 Tax=Methyloglobulus sp. TaxID=2518622 RepID=UPI003988C1A6
MNQRINPALACIFSIIALFAVNHSVSAKSGTGLNSVKVQVALNKSRLIKLRSPVAEISQANPAIADFPVDAETAETSFIPPNQLLIRGKSLGTTNLYLWDANGNIIKMLDIEVTHDVDSLKAQLHEVLPNERIAVRSAQKNIVLSGEISTLANMQAAMDVAQGYLGSSSSLTSKPQGGGGEGSINVNTNSQSVRQEKSKGDVPNVINLMSVGGAQQVMLDVKVAEIDRKLIKGLNVKFSALQVSDSFSIGAINGGGSANPTGIGGLLTPHSFDAGAVFLQAISGQFLFNLTVDAANDQQLAKILAQPTLTTLSGQPATFISGGEFPVPVAQGGTNNGSITIIFKEFGIGLKFVPVVLDSGRINLNMNVSVSELSEDAAVVAEIQGTSTALVIPSLTKREASSTLELADGQTMSIAGLISDRLRENVNKFPGLGDIPGLGALFRSSKFLNQQTELVIFVTPRLAKPILAQNAQLPTDSFVKPDDVDFYVLGRTESRKVRNRWVEDKVHTTSNKGGLDGEYGQQLIEGGQ